FWDSNAEVAHVIFGFRYFNAGLVLTFIEPLGVFYRVGIFGLGAFDLVALRITLRQEFQLVAKFFSVICFHDRAARSVRDTLQLFLCCSISLEANSVDG